MKISFLRLTKISWKLTAIYAFMFFVILFLVNMSILYGVKYYLQSVSINEVKNSSNILTLKIEHVSSNPRRLFTSSLFNEMPPIKNIHVIVTNELGEIINSSSGFRSGVPANSSLKSVQQLSVNNRKLVLLNRKVLSSEGIPIFLQVVKDMKDESEFATMLILLMIFASAGGIIISIFIGQVLSKKMLKPIDNITKAAQSISIYHLNKRIENNGPDDELSRLTKTFNEMIDRLQNSFDKQNQFVSDASHELRTPISVIQGYINLLDRWGKDDKDILEESIEIVKNETSNMTKLTEKLLFLARGGSNALKPVKEEFALNELIDEVVKESRIIAPEHDIINIQNDPLSINNDAEMLKQMLRAIIDNSIKFTPIGGKIEITSIAAKNSAKIIIKDSGIGIPKEDIPYIFNRFYRVDKSRVKEKGGSGLGLSIVKSIVDSYGGSISVESEPDKGTLITIVLPI